MKRLMVMVGTLALILSGSALAGDAGGGPKANGGGTYEDGSGVTYRFSFNAQEKNGPKGTVDVRWDDGADSGSFLGSVTC